MDCAQLFPEAEFSNIYILTRDRSLVGQGQFTSQLIFVETARHRRFDKACSSLWSKNPNTKQTESVAARLIKDLNQTLE